MENRSTTSCGVAFCSINIIWEGGERVNSSLLRGIIDITFY